MNFSQISRKSVIGKLLRLPLKLIPPTLVVPILQGSMRGKKWVAQSSTHGCWLGSYELEKQNLVAQYLQNGDVFYDLGANVGFYTVLASTIVGSTGAVYAFEPLPTNISYLKQHIKLNKLENVDIFDVAVSDTNTDLFFEINSSNLMGKLSSHGEKLVKSIKLDQFVSASNLRIPTAIKMDIEGAEFAALKGSINLLEQYPIKIFLAVHSDLLREQCTQFLQKLGYKVQPIQLDENASTDEFFCYK